MGYSCDLASDTHSCAYDLEQRDMLIWGDSRYNTITCNSGWFPQDADGNPFPGVSYCAQGDFSIDEAVYIECCNEDEECMDVYMGRKDCDDGGSGGSDGGEDYVPPSCVSGEYWNLWGAPGLGANSTAGSCTTCPGYNYASGKYFYDLASSSQRNTDTSAAGSGANVQFCYVPRGNVFTDNSGTFQYVNDCYYYGS